MKRRIILKNRYYNTLICTNLNKLFESNKSEKRVNESIKVNISTQTAYFDKSPDYPVNSKLYKLFNESNNIPSIAQIIETPKIPFEFSPNYAAFAEEHPVVSTPLYNKTPLNNNDLFVHMAKNMIANKKINEEKKFSPVVFNKNRLSTINKQRFYKASLLRLTGTLTLNYQGGLITRLSSERNYLKASRRLNDSFWGSPRITRT